MTDGAIYSVYLRSFSPEGTFAGLEQRMPELKQLGVTTLWLMPIHPVGVKNRKGTLGSPVCRAGLLRHQSRIRHARRLHSACSHTVHAQGMKLIIDLVANHTSWDSKLIAEHPEWFTRNARGEIIAAERGLARCRGPGLQPRRACAAT